MTALWTIAELKIDAIWKSIDTIIGIVEKGSVITQDSGIKVLAVVSSRKKDYEKKLFPYLIKFLKNSIPRDVPKYGESISVAVNKSNRKKFIRVLEGRTEELNSSQLKRVNKLLKNLQK